MRDTPVEAGAEAGAVMVADVGGTHCRIAVATGSAQKPRLTGLRSFPTPRDTLLPLLKDAGLHGVERIAIAAAGRIIRQDGDAGVILTNTGLRVSEADIRSQTSCPALLVNDLAAVAASVSSLSAADSLRVCGPDVCASREIVILGVGTGLGAALLTQGGEIIETEAGHVDMAAMDAESRQAVGALDLRRVSAESILSGSGLLRLFECRCGRPCSTVRELLDLAEAGDLGARDTLLLFSRWLGRVAGNMVLATGSWQGVYLVGGVVGGLGDWLDARSFEEGFVDKAPFSSTLAGVPVRRITHPQPALIGLARMSKNQEKSFE